MKGIRYFSFEMAFCQTGFSFLENSNLYIERLFLNKFRERLEKVMLFILICIFAFIYWCPHYMIMTSCFGIPHPNDQFPTTKVSKIFVKVFFSMPHSLLTPHLLGKMWKLDMALIKQDSGNCKLWIGNWPDWLYRKGRDGLLSWELNQRKV